MSAATIGSHGGPHGPRVSSAVRVAAAAVAGLTLLLPGCASRGLPDTIDPAVAERAIAATAPDRPLRVVFDWTILEAGGARFTGSGAARMEPPYRARLDLFGPRGDGYLSAALVGTDLRLPRSAPGVALPPPAMMWAVLGVVAPPADAVLVGTRVNPDRTELYYDVDESRLRYTLMGGRLTAARWDGRGRRMAVALTGSVEPGLPASAFFRDASAGTELKLNLEQVDEVEPHPPEIWTPGA